MAKVPDVVRVRRLYMAVAHLEDELQARLGPNSTTRQRGLVLDAIYDLREAYGKLCCAASDLQSAEEASE